MARAKNTSRAEARRRTKEQLRAETAEQEDSEDTLETSTATSQATAAPAARKPMFKMPDIRADTRALPSMVRGKPLLWVPFLLLLVGLIITLTLAALPAEVASIVQLYIQFFFIPPALFTFFIAGFVAPRASYMVGLIYGLIAGVMWSIVLITAVNGLTTGDTSPTTATDPIAIIPNMLFIGALYGTLAAAFAAWYRDFLRGMQDRGKARRAEQEEKDRIKRREERQETRRAAKQRPT